VCSDATTRTFCRTRSYRPGHSANGIPYNVIGVMKTKDQNSSYDGVDTERSSSHLIMKRDSRISRGVEHTVDRFVLVAPWSLATLAIA